MKSMGYTIGKHDSSLEKSHHLSSSDGQPTFPINVMMHPHGHVVLDYDEDYEIEFCRRLPREISKKEEKKTNH
jgi:hypothetical protein